MGDFRWKALRGGSVMKFFRIIQSHVRSARINKLKPDEFVEWQYYNPI